MEDLITITQEKYDQLVNDSEFLGCLEAAGVDNWDGYEIAQEEFDKINKEEE